MTDDQARLTYPYDKVHDYYVIKAWRDMADRPPAYTPQMVERHTQRLAEHPRVRPTRSGDERLRLGHTPGWPKNPDHPHDPEIPPQPLYAYRIGEPDDDDAAVKMVVTSGNHANEFTGNWMLEGLVNFLAGDDEVAAKLRAAAVFYIYPDINPDGRYQAIHRLEFAAAPCPNAGTDLRDRGNPHLYAAGEADNNRVWDTEGRFAHIDLLKRSMRADTGGRVDYLWDFHGPQKPANWRSPQCQAAWDGPYGRALRAREPEVRVAGLPGGFKANLPYPPGKLCVWGAAPSGLNARYTYVHEPGPWTEARLKQAGRNLVLALADVLR